MIVLKNPKTPPSHIKVYDADPLDKANQLKITMLTNKVMPEFIYSLQFYMEEQYDKIFIAVDESKQKICGAALVINKNKIEPSSKNNIEFLDFLMVDSDYQHQGVASLLINVVGNYAKQQNSNFIELNCPARNSDKINVYDKNDFNRFKLYATNNEINLVGFRVNVNSVVRDYAKILYACMLDSKNREIYYYDEYKQQCLFGSNLEYISGKIYMPAMQFKKYVNNDAFKVIEPALQTAIDEGLAVDEIGKAVSGILKLKSNNREINSKIIKSTIQSEFDLEDYCTLLNYSDVNNPKKLSFVSQVLNSSKDIKSDKQIYLGLQK